ncbi:MAG: ABC transporter permease, partial [Gemmataceae bacterium]
FFRNEEEPLYRNLAQKSLQISGGIMAVAGPLFSMLRGDFLLPVGLVFAVVGLLYLAAYVGTRGISDDLAYYTAVGIALTGGIVLLITLGRSLISENGSRYFVSYGIILVFLAVLYITVGLIASSDRPLFILTRRELGAFFYSPIAYLALLGFSLCWWGSYWTFLSNLFESSGPQMIEPIVRNYYFSLVPVITLLALVPALTMRLLSEEMRSGTMEVLLTAPVDEPAIVLSKFLATLITYMVMWIPSGLFLLGITLSGGTPFDYRPMLSFILVVLVTGASFVSMGLFFSSLTKSQIASFVITFAAMIGLLVVYFAGFIKQDNTWETVFKHLSFLDLWFSTLEGKIVPKFLLFPLSMTVLFLFMTVKVLESRKWR